MDSNYSILKQSRAEWLPLRCIQSEREVDRNSTQCNHVSKSILYHHFLLSRNQKK